MADVALTDAIQNHRTKVAADTPLSNIPENMDIRDLAVSELHRKFAIIGAGGGKDERSFGGGTYDYSSDMLLIAVWKVDVDVEATSDIMTNDMLEIDISMLKDSNRHADTVKVVKGTETVEWDDNSVTANMVFRVRCREARDMT